MLDDVVDALACPHCGAELGLTRQCLRCARDHVFDIARQGYVSLLPGSARSAGDTAAMVAARAEFLRAGHFAPILQRVARAVTEDAGTGDGYLLDVGAGTGDYLAHVLERCRGAAGIALDVSKYACRRAAKAHPRVGAVVADAWRRLPVRTGVVSTVLDVFAPRQPEELHRVLRPDGCLVVVIPDAAHLGELVSALALLTVDDRKAQRLDARLGGYFEPIVEHPVRFSMSLDADEVGTVVGMGPSAWHTSEQLIRERIAALTTPLEVTASVVVSVYRRVPLDGLRE